MDFGRPKILARPLTGYGWGMSGEVVGFYNAAGVPSVDSFALTLLIDMGIPGFCSTSA